MKCYFIHTSLQFELIEKMLHEIVILSFFLTASSATELREFFLFFLIISYIVILFWTQTFSYILADYIQVCGKRNPNLNQCILNSVEHVVPWLKRGIPELDIKPVDPVYVDSIVLQNDARFRLSASEILVYGLSNYKVNDANVDLDKQRIDLDVTFPKLVCHCKYNVFVTILVSFKGNGYSETFVGECFPDCFVYNYCILSIHHLPILKVQLFWWISSIVFIKDKNLW